MKQTVTHTKLGRFIFVKKAMMTKIKFSSIKTKFVTAILFTCDFTKIWVTNPHISLKC